MDTAGEPSAERVKRTHRGRSSSAAQEKRDQRNKWCFPGSFVFAWLPQKHGTTSCSVDSGSDRHDRSGRTRNLRKSRTEARVRDTSLAGGTSAVRAQEALGTDDGRFGFGACVMRYQRENFNGEDTGWPDWSRVFRTWAGRFQRGRVHDIIRAEGRPGDEAAVG